MIPIQSYCAADKRERPVKRSLEQDSHGKQPATIEAGASCLTETLRARGLPRALGWKAELPGDGDDDVRRLCPDLLRQLHDQLATSR